MDKEATCKLLREMQALAKKMTWRAISAHYGKSESWARIWFYRHIHFLNTAEPSYTPPTVSKEKSKPRPQPTPPVEVVVPPNLPIGKVDGSILQHYALLLWEYGKDKGVNNIHPNDTGRFMVAMNTAFENNKKAIIEQLVEHSTLKEERADRLSLVR